MQTIYTVTCQFDNDADAIALVDILRELGVNPKINHKQIGFKADGLTPMHATRLGKIMLDYMQIGRSYDPSMFEALLLEKGYQPRSTVPVLSKLIVEGKVERLGRGIYRKL